MIITECRIKLCENRPVCAIASVTFDDQFVVKGIRILQIDDRFIVCMPSRRGVDGLHRDVAHPINSNMRERLNAHVLGAYNEALNRQHEGLPVHAPFTEEDDLLESPEHYAP